MIVDWFFIKFFTHRMKPKLWRRAVHDKSSFNIVKLQVQALSRSKFTDYLYVYILDSTQNKSDKVSIQS